MIPSSYAGYFQAASQAAGALIGLLFVVIALKPGRIIGRHADPVARRLAASSFTGLVDAFFVSLLALIPGHDLGYGAAVMALLSLYHTLRLNLAYPGVRHTVIFAASLLAYGFQLCVAVAVIVAPDNVDFIKFLAFVLISAFAVGLNRAWALLESTAVAGAEEGQAKAPVGTAPHANGAAEHASAAPLVAVDKVDPSS
ncbi:MAG: hypothetical protein ABSB76_35045 [Streptosporangiaceae bacterium]